MYCPNCGNQISDQAQYCPSCNTSLIAPPSMGDVAATGSTKTSGLAIAALVLGILSLCCFGPLAAIPGLILGIVAVSRINANPLLGGKGLAIAGISTSAVGLVFMGALLVSIMLPAVSKARSMARQLVCASQMTEIGKAMRVYRDKNQGAYPPELSILVPQAGLDSKNLVCPSSEDKSPDFYVYRGADLKMLDELELIVVHDIAGNHLTNDARNVLFADGRVQKLSEDEFECAIAKDNQIRRASELPEKGSDGKILK
jgi:prepilin-type processing-associated H-X9-DG protein